MLNTRKQSDEEVYNETFPSHGGMGKRWYKASFNYNRGRFDISWVEVAEIIRDDGILVVDHFRSKGTDGAMHEDAALRALCTQGITLPDGGGDILGDDMEEMDIWIDTWSNWGSTAEEAIRLLVSEQEKAVQARRKAIYSASQRLADEAVRLGRLKYASEIVLINHVYRQKEA